MKKIFRCWVCLLCLLLVSCQGSAVDPTELSLLLQKRGEGYGLGTNERLQGELTVHLFYLNDRESSWEASQAEDFTQTQVLPGLRFLEEQAARYGLALDFSVESHSLGEGGEALFYDGRVNKDKPYCLDLPQEVAESFGYRDGMAHYVDCYEKNDHREVIFLYLINKDGTSYASKQVSGDRFTTVLEFGVIFRTALGKEGGADEDRHAAATVAHEILHLYGAEDLYTPDGVRAIAETYWPEDIMLLAYRNVEQMAVEALSAYSVGWRRRPPSPL